MGRVTEMRYPNGWVEYYTYDAMGRILAVEDTHPSEKPAKTQKHTYRYDANGNMTYEYMRGNGTGQAKNETLYTYDALNRLISAHDNYGNSTRTYTYDSLGNLTYETGNGSHNMDYRYNNLNQLVEQSDDGWKTYTTSSYDNRGNLILETYHKGNKASVTGAYTYDETNKMVLGVNDIGESSAYLYNGLGALMENTWVIKKNAYGYHDVRASAVVDGETVVDSATGKKEKKEKKTAEEVAASPTLNKTSAVVKQFVVDFSSETYKPLMEHEVNGLDYRYVYSDKARLSVVVQGIENGSASLLDSNGELHAYYHCDYLGTTDYLTSAVNSKVISWTSYNEWGEITHNAVLKCGQRELDLVKEYATHDFDAVLNQYYAKARFYDADNRRFTAVDPIKDGLNWYAYCGSNPINYVDIWGTKSDSVNNVVSNLKLLEGLAADYLGVNTSEKKESELVLQFLRRNGYADNAWSKIAGAIDENFVSYVKKTNLTLYNYFTVISCDKDFFVYGVSPTISGGTIDLWHFAATAGAQMYNSGFSDGPKHGLMPEYHMNNLAGWAGDLQTLLERNIVSDLGSNPTYEEVYKKTQDYLKNTNPDSSFFSYVDLLTDVDAYNIAQSLKKSNSITSSFEDYYTNRYTTRFTQFSNGFNRDSLRSISLTYTKLKFSGVIKWPLYTNNLTKISDNISKGVAYAYADYIWEQVQLETKK